MRITCSLVSIITVFILFSFFACASQVEGGNNFQVFSQLKQEQWKNQVIKLQDERILLINNRRSEIFNPYTNTSEFMDGWSSINVFTQNPQFTVLLNGDIFVTKGSDLGAFTCTDRNQQLRGEKVCPKNKTPLIEPIKKKIRWVSYPLAGLEGQSVTLLPDGNLLIIGGLYKNSYNSNNDNLTFNKSYFKQNISIYNPKTFQLRVLGHTSIARQNHKTVIISNQEALIIGGHIISGDYYKDSDRLNSRINSIELLNYKTGKTQIIGTLKYWADYKSEIIQLSKNNYLVCLTQYSKKYNKVISEVFHLNNPESTTLIEGVAKTSSEVAYKCISTRDKKALCFGSKVVRLINPIQKTDEIIARYEGEPLAYIMPFDINNIGLLIFGSKRFREIKPNVSPRETVYKFIF